MSAQIGQGLPALPLPICSQCTADRYIYISAQFFQFNGCSPIGLCTIYPLDVERQLNVSYVKTQFTEFQILAFLNCFNCFRIPNVQQEVMSRACCSSRLNTPVVTCSCLCNINLLLSSGADGLMGIYLFMIGAYDLKYRGEYNRHAQAWMDSIQCQVIGSLAMLSTEVSVLLLTYLTLEKYICIVYPFQYLTPGWRRTVSILLGIWVFGFIVAFLPLTCKEPFRNFYGTNGVCFPLHSEQPETLWAYVYSIVIFLGGDLPNSFQCWYFSFVFFTYPLKLYVTTQPYLLRVFTLICIWLRRFIFF